MIISLSGFMACGKSSSGKILARLLSADFIDLDEAVVESQNLSIPEIFSRGGESLFREMEFQSLSEILESHSGSDLVLALGGGAVTYEPTRKLLLEKTRLVYLKADLATIKKRLGDTDPSRPLFKNADELFEKRRPIYEKAGMTIDTEGKSPLDVAILIAKGISLL